MQCNAWQTVGVPAPALNGGFNTDAQHAIRIFTNATDDDHDTDGAQAASQPGHQEERAGGGVVVESATAWQMRSIWKNSTTHDRPGPA